ncbi:MAG: class I SAM-dependent methyltransferase [Candidatus Heimdallarchaeota archaeon]
MTKLSIGEEQLLTTLRLLELRSRDWETGEKIRTNQQDLICRGRLYFGKNLIDWTPLFELLIEKGFLQQSASDYSLTDLGRSYGDLGQKKWFIKGYDDLLTRSEQSQAHSIFCKRVYGRDLCQTGSTDMTQLEMLLQVLDLEVDSLVLDLGCGIGKITEYLSDSTQAQFIGVDITTNALYQARMRQSGKQNPLQYLEADLNSLPLSKGCLDAIIALDTIYFANDINHTLNQLKRLLKPLGQMAIFYSQLCYPDDPPFLLHPDNTELGRALRTQDLSYHSYNLTMSDHQIRRRQIQVGAELINDFQKEKNSDIYRVRNTEAAWALKVFNAGRGRRYLYHVQRSTD